MGLSLIHISSQGSVTVDGQPVTDGQTLLTTGGDFAVTPANGYELASIQVTRAGSTEVPGSYPPGGRITFAEDADVTVTFRQQTQEPSVTGVAEQMIFEAGYSYGQKTYNSIVVFATINTCLLYTSHRGRCSFPYPPESP